MNSAGLTSKSPFDFQLRASGVLMHITSLPGPHGSGDLGPDAHRFIDFLAAAGQSWWQMLPVGPTGYGGSPYSAESAFAGNPMLIDLQRLVEDGLLPSVDQTRPRGPQLRAAFGVTPTLAEVSCAEPCPSTRTMVPGMPLAAIWKLLVPALHRTP